jgi:hypothetical protein
MTGVAPRDERLAGPLRTLRLSLGASCLLGAATLMVHLYWQRHDHGLGLVLTASWLVFAGTVDVILYRAVLRGVRRRR